MSRRGGRRSDPLLDGGVQRAVVVAFFSLLAARVAAADATLGRLPLAFERNDGQGPPGAPFVARGAGYAVLLSPAGATLVLGPDRLRLGLEGTGDGREATLVGIDELPGKVHSFSGRDPACWLRDIPTFAGVEARQARPGVDLVWHGRGRDLELDLVLAPGARPESVALRIVGATRVALGPDGGLVLVAGQRELTLLRPQAFEEGNGEPRPVACSFALDDAGMAPADGDGVRVRFRVGDHDPARTLRIDPVLVYSTYLGGEHSRETGANDDSAKAIAVDAAGYRYVTGTTYSFDFPVTPGAPQPEIAGARDVFVAKLTPDGQRIVYATFLGGELGEDVQAIAVDAAGSAFVAGRTFSPDFPLVAALQNRIEGPSDGFVARLSPAGDRLVFSTYLGGSGDELVAGIALQPGGEPVVVGFTSSFDFPLQGAFQTALGGASDAFVTGLGADGQSLRFSTYLGGSLADDASSVAADVTGRIHVGGETASSDFPVPGAFQPILGGRDDAFVARLTADGSGIQRASFLGGLEYERPNAIAVDAQGSTYLAGYTSSDNFPTVNPVQGRRRGGVEDAFVAKVDGATWTLSWSTYLGGSDDEIATGIAVDTTGHAIVAGFTRSTNFPLALAVQSGNAGGDDAFVVRFDPSGRPLLFSTYLGGSGFDNAFGLALDPAGAAVLCGQTRSSDFPTRSPFQPAIHGLADGFVARIDPIAPALVDATYLGGVLDAGGETTGGLATDAGGNLYLAGTTQSFDFPGTASGPSAGSNAFVAKLSAGGGALVYTAYLGGSGDDGALALAVDPVSRGAAVTGFTTSPDYPVTGAVQTALGGDQDAFVTLLDPTGSRIVFSTYLGGRFEDHGRAIALDPGGDVLAGGFTWSDDFPVQSAMLPTRGIGCGGIEDGFLTRIDPTGPGLVYSTYFGSCDKDQVNAIAVDAQGVVTVAGEIESFRDLAGVTPRVIGPLGLLDGYVARVDPSGSRVLSASVLGGSDADRVRAVAIDLSGATVIAGETASFDFPVRDALQPAHAATAGDDAFVAVLAPDGSLDVSTYLGGSGDDIAAAVALDQPGNIFVAGRTRSSDLPVQGALQPAIAGREDAFLAKLTAGGRSIAYLTWIGGSRSDSAGAIAVDPGGDAWVAGTTESADFPLVDPLAPARRGASDVFLAQVRDCDRPGAVGNTVFAVRQASSLRLTWTDIPLASEYRAYEGTDRAAVPATLTGTAPSGAVGVSRALGGETLVLLRVAGASDCAEGPR